MKGNEIKILNAIYRNPRTVNRDNIRTYLDEIYGKQGFEWMDTDKYYLPMKTARLMAQLGKKDTEENAVAYGEEWQKVVELNRRLFERSSAKRKELIYKNGVADVLDDMRKKGYIAECQAHIMLEPKGVEEVSKLLRSLFDSGRIDEREYTERREEIMALV